MQLSDAVERFMDGYFSTCRRSEKTRAAYQIDLCQLKKYIGGSVPLKDVEPESIEHWAMSLRAGSYASVSVRRKLATTKVFFAYWIRKGAVEASPFWRIRLDLGTERSLPRSLAPNDAKRLIEEVWAGLEHHEAAIDGPGSPRFLRVRNLAAVEILFATGIRVGELVALGLRDWSEEERTFVVHGKGSRQRLAFLPDDRSFSAVRRYVKHRTSMSLGHDGLLTNASGSRISEQGIARIIVRIAERAQIATRVTPHMIRHTVATLLLRYGADIRVVQEVLGHSSIATTQRYTHVSKEHLFSALKERHPNHHLGISIPLGRGSTWSAAVGTV